MRKSACMHGYESSEEATTAAVVNTDPLVIAFDSCTLEYTRQVQMPLTSLLRFMDSKLHPSPSVFGENPSLSQFLGRVQKEVGDILAASVIHSKRRAAIKSKLLVSLEEPRSGARKKRCSKSAARQQAGKRKVGSLSAWQSCVSEAIQVLKSEGYVGEMKLAKGSPLYSRAKAIQKARARHQSGGAASSNTAGLVSSLPGDVACPVPVNPSRRQSRKKPCVSMALV